MHFLQDSGIFTFNKNLNSVYLLGRYPADGLSDGPVNGPADCLTDSSSDGPVDVRTDVAAPLGLIKRTGLSTLAQVKRYLSQHLTDEFDSLLLL